MAATTGTSSRFAVIDLDQLQRMAVLEDVDSEETLASRMTKLVELWKANDPPAGAVYDVEGLEFDPIKINQEVSTFFEILLRDRVNQAARAVTLAFGTGTDLDAIASRYPGGVPRDPDESDERYRRRVWLAANALSPHGTPETYAFFALTADGSIRDATAVTVEGTGVVSVTILPEASFVPTTDQLLTARAYLLDPSRKGLTDVLHVLPPVVVPVRYEIDVWLYPGPDETVLLAELYDGLDALIEEQRWLGYDHTITAIHGVFARGGVHRATILSPAADVLVSPRGVVQVTDVKINYRGRDE
jgi:phage-related baseplate assembly protein